MAKFIRTITVEDQRAGGDHATNDAIHFAHELAQKGLTVDALGSEEVPLRREGDNDNGDAMVAAVREEYARAANFTATKESLDEKIRALFESQDAGYVGYALQKLRNGKIAPNNLPEGSAPLWESPEAALSELLANLTPAIHEVIDRDYTTPAIVIEPVMSHEAVYVRDHETTDYDCRVVGNTPFYVSEWAAQDLDETNQRNEISSTDGERIVGWRIGIADKAKVTKVLGTDGDVESKELQDRARDFHGEGGYGKLGFFSVADHPILYGLMMNRSRNIDQPNPIDDVHAQGGVWTMGTHVDSSSEYPRVAGGRWSSHIDRALLLEDDAYVPNGNARVRLALMFNKS